MDIIERLENDEMFVDAIDDAIYEIKTLREDLAEFAEKYYAMTLLGRAWKCANPKCKGYYVAGYICQYCGGDNSVSDWENET